MNKVQIGIKELLNAIQFLKFDLSRVTTRVGEIEFQLLSLDDSKHVTTISNRDPRAITVTRKRMKPGPKPKKSAFKVSSRGKV